MIEMPRRWLKRNRINVKLPPNLVEGLERAIAAGHAVSPSDFVRAALREKLARINKTEEVGLDR
jgi:Arc/MetJ-type ribon-helix-helix transcriptional regulator